MKQTSFLQNVRKEHGGILTVGKRNSRRPLTPKKPVHLVLRSDLAKGKRSLLRNRKIVEKTIRKFSERFCVQVYEEAICGNHIHLFIKGETRRDLQNFIRVVAGQIAQQILIHHPLPDDRFKAFRGGTHFKNQKTFWSFLAYTRLVSWGRDFGNVRRYVVRNMQEALGLIPYKETKSRFEAKMAVLLAKSSLARKALAKVKKFNSS